MVLLLEHMGLMDEQLLKDLLENLWKKAFP